MTSPNSANQDQPPGGPIQNLLAGMPPLNQVFNFAGRIASSASGGTGYLGDGINPMAQPPSLKTLVYSPEVKVIISHLQVMYDVSSDVVRCELIRPENSAATFICTLQNKNLRYTPMEQPRFSRMDRIVVYMKKTGWNQVFSGYLDSVPYRQLYPGTVEIRATCTIKRIMHTWFNPDLPESASLLNQLSVPGGPDLNPTPDSGLGTILERLLTLVGGWDVTNIHIQNFPVSFMNFLTSQLQGANASATQNRQHIADMLMGSDHSPGPGSHAGNNPNAGAPGPSTPGVGGVPGASGSVANTPFYIAQIVAACDERGMGPLVSDNNLGAGIVQAGETGEASTQSYGEQKAWQQVQQTGLDHQQANRNSDAAILGAAAAMAVSGAGTSILNLCNPAVPGSDQWPNDGPSAIGTQLGIFQLPNAAEWGDVGQRMNPKQSAGMFFHRLNAIAGWRNMDPGAAIQQALRSTSSAAYAAAVVAATDLVKAYRTGTAGTASTTVTGSGVTVGTTGGSVTTAAGAPGANPNLVTGGPSAAPQPVVAPNAVSPTRQGKPNPDSEGAINWAMTALGRPFEFGGKGPGGYDAPGLVSAAFKAIGIFVPAQTDTMRGQVPEVPVTSIQRGDIVQPTQGHVAIWCGDGTVIEATPPMVPVSRNPVTYGDPSSFAWVGRACANGGPDPTAPFSPPETMGPGTPPSALHQQGGAISPGSSGADQSIARNLMSYWFQGTFTSEAAQMFKGKKAFMTGQPLIQWVEAVASAGLRSWSSAPNGDFMAWYPDYWGLDGKPAVLRLEDIELKDVNINFNDDALTTHVYVAGDYTEGFGSPDPLVQWSITAGVVTTEDVDTWLYQRLIQIAPPDENLSGDALIRRFGIRPFKKVFAIAGQSDLEKLLSMKVFMEQWARQYQTTISMTFMPELFPGMRVDLAGKNIQVYVSAVHHVCDFEQGFSTQATIMAPSIPMAKKAMALVQTSIPPPPELLDFNTGVDRWSDGDEL